MQLQAARSPGGQGEGRRRLRQRFKLVLSLCLFGLFLVLGEVGLRLFAPETNLYTGAGLYQKDPDCGYVLRPGARGKGVIINSHGLRDVERGYAKPDGVKRVLVLGDSFTFAAVDPAANFVSVLGEQLGPGVDVINSGVPGWSTAQQLAWLKKEGLRYDPDVIVIAFFVGNDVFENAGFEKRAVVRNEFAGGDSDRKPWSRVLRTLNRSHLYRALRRLPKDVSDRVRGETRLQRSYYKLERHRVEVCAKAGFVIDLEPGWRATYEKLAGICQLAGARPVLLLLIPDEIQVDAALRHAVLERFALCPDDYEFDLPQRRLRALAEELEFATIDPLEELGRRTAAGERFYLPFDSHWNEAGNRFAGEALAHHPVLGGLAGGG